MASSARSACAALCVDGILCMHCMCGAVRGWHPPHALHVRRCAWMASSARSACAALCVDIVLRMLCMRAAVHGSHPLHAWAGCTTSIAWFACAGGPLGATGHAFWAHACMHACMHTNLPGALPRGGRVIARFASHEGAMSRPAIFLQMQHPTSAGPHRASMYTTHAGPHLFPTPPCTAAYLPTPPQYSLTVPN
eukprot:351549-Chlamydomonas_euryale.AAC.1